MKRLTALLLILALCLSLAACGENATAGTEPTEQETTEATEATEETQPTEDTNRLAYDEALALLEEGSFDEAKEAFAALGRYEDADEMVKECDYRKAAALLAAGENRAAYDLYGTIADYKDAAELQESCRFVLMEVRTTTEQDGLPFLEKNLAYENGALKSVETIYNHEHPNYSSSYWDVHMEYYYEDGYVTIHTFDLGGDLLNSEMQKYDEAGNMVRINKIYPKNASSNYTYEYSYDEAGRVLGYVSYNSATGEGNPSYKYDYTYDEYGNMVLSVYSKYTWGTWEEFRRTEYDNVYNEEGQLIRYTTDKSAYVWEFTYDDQGRKDSQSMTGEDYATVTTYTYDESGNLTEEMTVTHSGDSETTSVLTHYFEPVELFAPDSADAAPEEPTGEE